MLIWLGLASPYLENYIETKYRAHRSGIDELCQFEMRKLEKEVKHERYLFNDRCGIRNLGNPLREAQPKSTKSFQAEQNCSRIEQIHKKANSSRNNFRQKEISEGHSGISGCARTRKSKA